MRHYQDYNDPRLQRYFCSSSTVNGDFRCWSGQWMTSADISALKRSAEMAPSVLRAPANSRSRAHDKGRQRPLRAGFARS
jgi:hypothetical protein